MSPPFPPDPAAPSPHLPFTLGRLCVSLCSLCGLLPLLPTVGSLREAAATKGYASPSGSAHPPPFLRFCFSFSHSPERMVAAPFEGERSLKEASRRSRLQVSPEQSGVKTRCGLRRIASPDGVGSFVPFVLLFPSSSPHMPTGRYRGAMASLVVDSEGHQLGATVVGRSYLRPLSPTTSQAVPQRKRILLLSFLLYPLL